MFKISFQDKNLEKEWDVIIVGGGPAGYSAALYCARYKLKTLVITNEIGGTLLEASIIEDYPGIKKIKGSDLAKLFKEHAEEWGAKTLIDEVIDISKKNDEFVIKTKGGLEFKTKAVILATGSKRRRLKVPGENLPGVSYCAECDAPLFKGKVVAVVGGGNTAFHDALVLANHAKKVYLIHRREEFRADPVVVEQAKKNPKIEFVLNKVVIEIKGDRKVERIILKDVKSNEISELKVDGIFVAIGLEPSIELAEKLGIKLDETKHIVVDSCMRTNIPGVFAAGDITNGSCNFRQIITAAAEGAIAAFNVFRYILDLKTKSKS